VAIAGCAPNLGSRLPECVVLEEDDCLGVDRLVKRWPTTVAVEFGSGDKQFSATPTARVEPGAVLFQQLARPRPFGAGLAQHVELFGGQNVAPFGVGSLAGIFRHAHH